MRLILLDFWEDIQTFLETGGDVLVVILFVTFLMWVLLVERMWYMAFIHPQHAQKVIDNMDDKTYEALEKHKGIIAAIKDIQAERAAANAENAEETLDLNSLFTAE